MFSETIGRIKGSVIATAIASILLGILFLAKPILSGVTICYFIGALLIIVGIAKVVFSFINPLFAAQSIVGGVLLFLIGLICFSRPDVIASVLTLLAGIYIIADGAVVLSEGIFALRAKISGALAVVIFAILFMICGFYVMFAPFSFIMEVAGVVMICDGIFNIVFVAVMSNKISEARKTFEG